MNRIMAAAAVLLALLAAGCGRGSAAADAEAAGYGARYLLADEPSEAVGVLDAREDPATGDGSATDVVLVGRIGGVSEPFTRGRAVFTITDPSTGVEDEEHPHECGEDCPYCSKKQDDSQSLAFVQFLADDGSVLEIDARELFPVAAGHTVVVRGQARLDESGYLIVSASGLYIRK
jgi:hypothetical protein